MSDIKQSITNLIRTCRIESGMVQSEVAKRVGISFRTYQRIELGEVVPRTDVMIRLLDLFGLEAKLKFVDIFSREKMGENK
ncbi:MAG: helix-turn-helix transcriptional regulator [Bdellovibrionales bacterium]